ncbi:MAG: imidazole glycerol phosphate synthase subunit HisH, partial [Maritimibacter sp.]
IVLPGDGAFPACLKQLFDHRGIFEAMDEAVNRRAVPVFGICIGMQMLADLGREYEDTPGFGWIGGEVVAIAPSDPTLKVPHMGWNDLVIDHAHPVLEGIETGEHAYFVHSYHFKVTDPAHRIAHCDYAGDITAIVGRDNLFGTQFHPEKSQAAGLKIIGNFLSWQP